MEQQTSRVKSAMGLRMYVVLDEAGWKRGVKGAEGGQSRF